MGIAFKHSNIKKLNRLVKSLIGLSSRSSAYPLIYNDMNAENGCIGKVHQYLCQESDTLLIIHRA
jgi:hypothetical protein